MLDDKTMKQYKEEFGAKGEEKVKIELASGRYGNPEDHSYPKACYAKMWLEEKERAEQKAIVGKNLNVSRQLVIATRWLVIITALLVLVTFIKK